MALHFLKKMSEPKDDTDIVDYPPTADGNIGSVVTYSRNIEYLRSDYAGASDMIDCE